MKLINKIKNIILLIAVVLMMVPGDVIKAASNTITTGDSTKILKYIGYSGNETKFAIKKLANGDLAYCMDHKLATPDSGLTYTMKNNVTDKYPGIIYILQNGYPNKKKASKYLTGNNNFDYYITQGAIHWYIDRVNKVPDTAAKGKYSYQQLGSGFKTTAPDSNGLRPYIKALVEDAITATNGVDYDAKPVIKLNNSSQLMEEDGDYWVSKKFTVDTENNAGDEYTVKLNGNVPTDTAVYDVNGTPKTTFNMSEGFIVKTPKSSITENSANFNVTVTTTNGTIIRAYQYTTSKKNASGATPQDIAVIDKETVNVAASKSLKITISQQKVKFAKIGIDTRIGSRSYVSGAVLQYYDKDTEEVIGQITSSTEPVEVSLLPGNYCLKEVRPPAGYIKTNSEACFTVETNGNILDFNTQEVISSAVIELTNNSVNLEISKVDDTQEANLVSGATLTLFKVQTPSNDEDHILTREIKSWSTSDTNPMTLTSIDLNEQGWYMIKETETPAGYIAATPTYFHLSANGVIGYNTKPVTSIQIKNVRTITNVYKTDITGTKEIEGAHLRVLDSNGKVVDEWDSEGEPHPISGLGAGLTYLLEETIAPEGYALTSAVEFTVNENGTITEVTLKNDIIRLTISKQDITNSKELPGAHLVIRKENGDIYLEWDSTDEEKVIEMIPAGTYTLEETTSPDGYVLNTEVITFVIKEDGTITDVDGNPIDKVIMYNTPETPVPKTAANISVFVYLIGIIAISGGAYLLYNKKKLNK